MKPKIPPLIKLCILGLSLVGNHNVVAAVQQPRINEVSNLIGTAPRGRGESARGLSIDRMLKEITSENDSSALYLESIALVEPTLSWMPDGKSIVAALPYRDGTTIKYGVFMLDARTGGQTRLADGLTARISPNGRYLAFLTEHSELAVGMLARNRLSRLGIQQQDLTPRVGLKLNDFAWSPDSQSLVISATNGEKNGADNVTEGSMFSFDLRRGVRRQLCDLNENVDNLLWTKRGIFITKGIARMDAERPEFVAEIAVLNPVTGRIKDVVKDSGFILRMLAPSISPDGNKLAFGHDPQFPQHVPTGGFMVPATYDLNTGETHIYAFGRSSALMDIPPPRWGPGPRQVTYICKRGALFSSLCMVDVDTREVKRLDLNPLRDIARLAISPIDGRIAVLSEDPLGTIRLTVTTANGSNAVDIYSTNRFDLQGIALGRMSTVDWSTKDGLSFTGLLILPVNYVVGTRYPLLVDIHGGPYRGIELSAALTNKHPLEWQMWAAKGYAVFVADYRKGGVAGLDPELHHRVHGFLLDGDVADVEAGVSRIVEIGVADPERIVAIGHSFGGLLLNWWLTKGSGLFRAVITHEGSPVLYPRELETDSQPGPVWLGYERWLLGTDETHRRKIADDNSALSYTERIKTPVLAITGAPTRVDFGRRYVDSINRHGGCARLVEYPDEGHNFKEPENLRDMLESAIAWSNYWIAKPMDVREDIRSSTRKGCPGIATN